MYGVILCSRYNSMSLTIPKILLLSATLSGSEYGIECSVCSILQTLQYGVIGRDGELDNPDEPD